MSGASFAWSEPAPPPLPEFDGVIEPVVAARIAEMETVVAECAEGLRDRSRAFEHGGLQQRRAWALNEMGAALLKGATPRSE